VLTAGEPELMEGAQIHALEPQGTSITRKLPRFPSSVLPLGQMSIAESLHPTDKRVSLRECEIAKQRNHKGMERSPFTSAK
jgi:hypothetical protein